MSRNCDDLEMEPSDLNTHLPPRKRLLAGLRTAASALDAEPNLPSPAASADLAARLREVMALASSSSPGEMVEAARAAAAAAADAAAAARSAAAEKAAVAARARASARAAMEFLESFPRTSGAASRNGLRFNLSRSRKKHVRVKLLYKPDGRGGEAMGSAPPKPRRRRDSDEDVAHRPHRVMNNSPPRTSPKRRHSTAGGGKDGEGQDACNGSSTHMPIEVGRLANGCSEWKRSERTVPLFKHEGRDDIGEDSSLYSAKSSDVTDNGVGVGNSSASRKVKIKKKELLVNPHSSKETGEPIETEPSPIHSVVDDESKSNGNGAEKRASPADAKSQSEPVKITSVWKFKKFKSSHCSSDSKVLHSVCSSSSPSAAETSASVKAD